MENKLEMILGNYADSVVKLSDAVDRLIKQLDVFQRTTIDITERLVRVENRLDKLEVSNGQTD